jgi:hypothetical protein
MWQLHLCLQQHLQLFLQEADDLSKEEDSGDWALNWHVAADLFRELCLPELLYHHILITEVT